MTLLQLRRNKDGWGWPKTVLDFAAASEITRANLDALMNALDGLLGGSGVSVTIQDVLVHGEDQITRDEIIFRARVPPHQWEQEVTLQREWYNEILRIAPHCIYFVDLYLLPAHPPGDKS
jgi:hypothetical protein